MGLRDELLREMQEYGVSSEKAVDWIERARKTRVSKIATNRHSLPPGWEPNEKCYEYGITLGLTIEQIHTQAQKLRFWAGSNQHRPIGKKSNWYLAFMNWLLNYSEKINGSGTGAGRKNNRELAFDAARDRIASRFGLGETTPRPYPHLAYTNADGFIESENPAVGICIEAKPVP